MTNFEIALRTPLIMRVPWKKASVGRVTDVLAEAVDLYPTLAALVGLPPPRDEGEGINGTSLEAVFDAPAGGEGGRHLELKAAAFAQFAKPYRAKPFAFWPTQLRNETEVMGYTVRSDLWRYTCWFGFDKKRIVPVIDDILGRELYVVFQ